MKDVIVAFKDKYIYKDKEYFFTFELKKQLNRFLKREIFIMDEEIFIKTYIYNEKNIEDFIEKKIQKDFIDNKEFLYHYEVDKRNNKAYLYAIRGIKIESIINAKTKIIPITFLIKDIVIKSSKCNNFIVIVYVNEKFYVIFVEEKKLVEYKVINDIEKIHEILINNADKKIFIDINEDFKIKNSENRINILEKINEKIYNKQKFFT